MKKVILFFALVALTSCNNQHTPSGKGDFETIVIEDCEYLIRDTYFGNAGYGFMAHKGNCKNPIHKN